MAGEKRVLIIEDDKEIVRLLQLHLHEYGLATEAVFDGESGVRQAREGNFDLIILDLMLPAKDGLEVCRTLREARVETPILMLTAKSEELDKVVGLELGADDYVTKPFGVRELMARVRALLRRADRPEQLRQEGEAEAIDCGTLRLELGKRRVYREDVELDLTPREYELLELLCRHPGQAFSRAQLLEQVWGYQYEGYSHTVNSHINRLRAKVEDNPAEPKLIQTVWGFGYRFSPGERPS